MSWGIYWNGLGSPVSSSDGRRNWINTCTELWICGSRYGGVRKTMAYCKTSSFSKTTTHTIQLTCYLGEHNKPKRKWQYELMHCAMQCEWMKASHLAMNIMRRKVTECFPRDAIFCLLKEPHLNIIWNPQKTAATNSNKHHWYAKIH